MPTWDPTTYAAFADERGRPFADLLARVGAGAPATVLDVGCGTATLTAGLASRWPAARVHGIDSSPEMVAAAAGVVARMPGVEVELADLETWEPEAPVDVVVSNAVLQWLDDPLAGLRRLASWVAPGGWLAVQVPGNGDAPTHRLLAEVAADPRFASTLAGRRRAAGPGAPSPLTWLEALADGFAVDAWETTYVHVLPGEDAVLRWVSGTALRPVLDALVDEPDLRDAFVAHYGNLLREAYPRRPWGTALPFRRVFGVARRREAC